MRGKDDILDLVQLRAEQYCVGRAGRIQPIGAREKCPVVPGLGARMAAAIIMESMEKMQTGTVPD
jgi:hypothetical protein